MQRGTLVLAAILLTACGGGTEDGASGDQIDVRVTPGPVPEHGLQFVTPDLKIAPYSEEMYCIALEPLAEDIAVQRSEAFQGQFGHHLVVLSRTNVTDAGDVERCSDAQDMWQYGLGLRPGIVHSEGMAEHLAAGLQLMLQIHYVNTTDKELLVRDVLDVYTVPVESVTTWVGNFIHTDLHFELPAGESQVVIDCNFTQDVSLIQLLGHMHEWGTSTQILFAPPGITRTEDMTLLYEVAPWRVEFRDDAPVHTFDAPMELHAGDSFRTICSYYNDTDHTIRFPEEMCAATGQIYPYQGSMVCGGVAVEQ